MQDCLLILSSAMRADGTLKSSATALDLSLDSFSCRWSWAPSARPTSKAHPAAQLDAQPPLALPSASHPSLPAPWRPLLPQAAPAASLVARHRAE